MSEFQTNTPSFIEQQFALSDLQAENAVMLEEAGVLDRAKSLLGQRSALVSSAGTVDAMIGNSHLSNEDTSFLEVVFMLTETNDDGAKRLPIRVEVGAHDHDSDKLIPNHGFTAEDLTLVTELFNKMENAKLAGIIPNVADNYLDIKEPASQDA